MKHIKRIFSKENCIHPNSYFIRLTNDCNQNCLFCNTRGSFEELSTEEAKKKIKEICSNSQKCVIQFTGGEPCLRSNLIDLIKYAKKNNAERVVIQTNAVLLADKNYLKKLTSAGLDGGIVSFHTHRKEISQILSGSMDTFEKNLKGIKNLITSKINILLNIVLTKLNYPDLPNITKYILTEFTNIDGIIFSVIQPHRKAFINKWIVPTLSEIIPSLRKSMDMCIIQNTPYHISYCENPLCFILKLCDETLNKEIIKKIKIDIKNNNCLNCHLRNEMKKEKKKFQFCRNCTFNSYCSGVWKKYIEIHGEKEFLKFLI